MADYMDDIDAFVTEESKAVEFKLRNSRKRVGTTTQTLLSKKRVDEIEVINRNKALGEPIPSSSMGYKLLQKFGFREKEGASDDILSHAHITSNLGRSRIGLGIAVKSKVSAVQKILQEKELQSKNLAAQVVLTSDFLVNQRRISSQREVVSDVGKALKAIYELDIRKGVVEHALWPSIRRGNNEDDVYSDERRDEAISYLRKVHFYCLYCGCEFENEDDLSISCPEDKDNH